MRREEQMCVTPGAGAGPGGVAPGPLPLQGWAAGPTPRPSHPPARGTDWSPTMHHLACVCPGWEPDQGGGVAAFSCLGLDSRGAPPPLPGPPHPPPLWRPLPGSRRETEARMQPLPAPHRSKQLLAPVAAVRPGRPWPLLTQRAPSSLPPGRARRPQPPARLLGEP